MSKGRSPFHCTSAQSACDESNYTDRVRVSSLIGIDIVSVTLVFLYITDIVTELLRGHTSSITAVAHSWRYVLWKTNHYTVRVRRYSDRAKTTILL